MVLLRKGFSEHELVLSGLVGKSERGLYDRFRGRIMFPITDSQGVIVAFSGRVMPGTRDALRGETGKYINSPETSIYHKSAVLFGFSFAKKSISESHHVTIVEGQFDAILLHQSGYTGTVALSGTAATDRHMEQVARFAQEIIIATDGDRAGIASAHKIAMLGYRFDLDVSLVILPDGKDPADIIATNPADWKILIDNKKDYIAFHGEITKSRTLRERIISVETHLFPLLAAMQNHVHRDAKLQSIANQLQVSHESIRAEFQKFIQNYGQNTLQNFTSTAQPNTSSVVSESRNSLDTQLDELSIIRTLYASETQSWFDNHADVTTLLAAYTKTISDNQLAAAPMRYESLDETSWQIKLDTLWLRIQQIQIDTDIQKIRASIHLAGDDDSIQNLQQQLLSLQSKKETLVRSLAE
jgi:DNA primase